MSAIYDQRKLEREAEYYKVFMRVAKRIKRREYDNKWEIVPDVNDPLRKFTLERDAGWFRLKLCVTLQEYYHRSVYDDTRTDWRGIIAIKGMYGSKDKGESIIATGMRVKPRMAKKLQQAINEVFIPKFYETVAQERGARDTADRQVQQFNKEISKVLGLKKLTRNPNQYYRHDEPTGSLDRCPFPLRLDADKIRFNGEMTYDEFANMAKAMKWGGYK